MEIRTEQPKNNKYYIRKRSGGYSDAIAGRPTISGADVLCNCVGFANSRFAEVQGLGYIKYQLVCNAENFIEKAKSYGLKISKVPVQGGIMVWQKGKTLSDNDGAGHVAVVEEVYEDGTILTSESGYNAFAFKTVHRSNDNGRWGQASGYSFRGCIINPGVTDPKIASVPKLTVDGVAGPATIRATQAFFGTPEDGVLSGQNRSLKKYYPNITAVQYGKNGSTCVKKLQKWLGVTQDGVIGVNTVKAWQKKLGITVDGVFGAQSVRAWQTFLNTGELPEKELLVMDVSEFQSAIDWSKAKSDIEGVIVRCGYRGAEKGTLAEDTMFLKHIQGAAKAGLKTGLYMFTQAITADEGKKEAAYALNLLKKSGVKISYPIAVDVEAVYYKKNGKQYAGRANGLSKAKRTEAVKAFCEEIKAQGYEPMIYASLSWLNNKLDMSKLPYKVWCAQYNSVCEYKGEYILWQYTSAGKVDGYSGSVDLSRWHK